MSSFEVKVSKIENIFPIDGADKIELVLIDDYKSVVQKNNYKVGDNVIYIPEASLIPQNILEEMNLVGKLAGSNKNRVKAIRIRGQVSQGLIYPNKENWPLGFDCKEILGIEKFIPTVPEKFASSNTLNVGVEKTISYDIENIKKYKTLFDENDDVVITEKIHGTNFCAGIYFNKETLESENIVHSKGLGQKGLAIEICEETLNNTYVKTSIEKDLHNKLRKVFPNQTVFILGEIFGNGVQKGFHYGNFDKSDYRVFDIHLGDRYTGRWANDSELDEFCKLLELKRVPILYRGKFSKEITLSVTSGKETVSGKSLHMREGCVVRTQIDQGTIIGRKQLKSISDEYLLRGKGNDEEETEFE